MVELCLWCLPLVFLSIVIETNLLSFLFDGFSPLSSTIFVTALTGVAVFIIGILYFALTQYVIFGYVESKTFMLKPLPNSSLEGVAYVGNTRDGVYIVKTVDTFGKRVEESVPTEDVEIKEVKTNKPRLVCERFATRFPRTFSGEFETPADGANCMAVVPPGTVDSDYMEGEK